LSLFHNGKQFIQKLLDPDPKPDDCQNLMLTSLSNDTSLIQFPWRYNQKFCVKLLTNRQINKQIKMKSAQRRANTARWRWSLHLPTNPVWWGSMHAISSYHGNRPTPPVRHRQGRLQYTAPQLSAQCNKEMPVNLSFLTEMNTEDCCGGWRWDLLPLAWRFHMSPVLNVTDFDHEYYAIYHVSPKCPRLYIFE